MHRASPPNSGSAAPHLKRLSILLLASIMTMNCTSDSNPDVTVTDSAGVLIVENHGSVPEVGGAWALSSEPTLTIGTIEGDPEYQFYGISGVRRLSGGRIGVVNTGSQEVRFYGPGGEFLTSFGQRGGGPEEFENPVLAGSMGDTIIVVDRAHHRLTLVHPDQGFVGLARVSDEVGGFLNPSGAFANGQTVYGGAFDMRRTGELKTGMNRAGTFYRSSALDGSLVADFGDKDGAEFFIKDIESEGRDSRPALTPFARTPQATVSPRYFFFGAQDQYQIEAYDPSGKLVRLIRLEVEPIPVTPADGERHIESVVEQVGSPDQEAAIRAQLGPLPLPEVFPPHGGLLADRMDYLWVEDFQRPGRENRSWNIFDPEGALAGRITLPERFNPAEIGADYILGLGWDEMNVEYVRMYELTRGS